VFYQTVDTFCLEMTSLFSTSPQRICPMEKRA